MTALWSQMGSGGPLKALWPAGGRIFLPSKGLIGYGNIDHLHGALGVMSRESLTWRREFPLGYVFLVVLVCWQFLFLASFNPYNSFVRFSYPLVITELLWIFVEHLLCAMCREVCWKIEDYGFCWVCIIVLFWHFTWLFTSFRCCSNTVRLLLSTLFLRWRNWGWVSLSSWIYLTSQSESFVSCARVWWLQGTWAGWSGLSDGFAICRSCLRQVIQLLLILVSPSVKWGYTSCSVWEGSEVSIRYILHSTPHIPSVHEAWSSLWPQSSLKRVRNLWMDT